MEVMFHVSNHVSYQENIILPASTAQPPQGGARLCAHGDGPGGGGPTATPRGQLQGRAGFLKRWSDGDMSWDMSYQHIPTDAFRVCLKIWKIMEQFQHTNMDVMGLCQKHDRKGIPRSTDTNQRPPKSWSITITHGIIYAKPSPSPQKDIICEPW